MRRNPGPAARRVVAVAKRPVEWATRFFCAGEISGREHLPQQRPFIVAANHLSLTDPVFVTMAVGELVRFLALDELFGQSKARDEMFFYFGSIPISRDRPPLGALQHALDVLDAGEILGLFPEGARALYWGERSIKRGAAWLSMATGTPIVPCAITGTEATMSLANPGVHIPSLRLSFHPSLDPASYLDYEDPLQSMMDDWVGVLDEQLTHWHQEDET